MGFEEGPLERALCDEAVHQAAAHLVQHFPVNTMRSSRQTEILFHLCLPSLFQNKVLLHLTVNQVLGTPTHTLFDG